MRIAFLTACLEPGRDGVGDYVRLLAEECTRRGHECLLLAVNDSFLTSEFSSGENASIPVARCGLSVSWGKKTAFLRERLDAFNPDFVSVQMVLYAFHAKGLPFGLSKRLGSLLKGFRTKILFHELWIGAQAGRTLKEALIGRLQRSIIRDLIRKLGTECIATTNSTYAALLCQARIKASITGMFGAIPVGSHNEDKKLFAELRGAGLPFPAEEREQVRLGVFFGQLHPEWPPEPLFETLHQAAKDAGKRVAIVSAGRLGSGAALWEALATRYSGRFVFLRLGELPPKAISRVFNSSDFGFATSPRMLLGKSASAAAMLEHGLRLIVNRNEIQFPGIADPGLPPGGLHLAPDYEALAGLMKPLSPKIPAPRLASVADAFLSASEQTASGFPPAASLQVFI